MGNSRIAKSVVEFIIPFATAIVFTEIHDPDVILTSQAIAIGLQRNIIMNEKVREYTTVTTITIDTMILNPGYGESRRYNIRIESLTKRMAIR